MITPKAIAAAGAVLIIVAGGTFYLRQVGVSSHHTVDWYLQHDAERERTMRDCGNDHARDLDPDCMNALAASHGALARQLGNSGDPFGDIPAQQPQPKPH